MMVTVEPFASVINTCPPGFSRMNAPPPSAARMTARMGVGSAVTVEVGVSVGKRVAGVDDGLGVLEAVLAAGMASTAVAWASLGEGVIDGMAKGVEVDSITVTGSGVESPVVLMIQLPKFV